MVTKLDRNSKLAVEIPLELVKTVSATGRKAH